MARFSLRSLRIRDVCAQHLRVLLLLPLHDHGGVCLATCTCRSPVGYQVKVSPSPEEVGSEEEEEREGGLERMAKDLLTEAHGVRVILQPTTPKK